MKEIFPVGKKEKERKSPKVKGIADDRSKENGEERESVISSKSLRGTNKGEEVNEARTRRK